MNDDKKLEELEFPVVVHFKVIGEVSDSLRTHLEIALWELGIQEELTPGRISSSGKYTTFNLSMTVQSRENLRAIDARLREVNGVKMVL